MSFTLSSPVFKDGQRMPEKYVHSNGDVSPPLCWNNPPKDAKSFALLMEDGDAPLATAGHWILYNIPSSESSLPEKMPYECVFEDGKAQGKNIFRKTGYLGPAPPWGQHTYVFRLFALDTVLPELKNPKRKQFLKHIEGHVLDETRLSVVYKK